MLRGGALASLIDPAGRRVDEASAVQREREAVEVKDGWVESCDRSEDRAVGLRMLRRGSWGFAATDRSDEVTLGALVDRAVERAEAWARARRRAVVLAPLAPQRGSYRTELARDPFAVPVA